MSEETNNEQKKKIICCSSDNVDALLKMFGFCLEFKDALFFLKFRIFPSDSLLKKCAFSTVKNQKRDFFYDQPKFKFGTSNQYLRKRIEYGFNGEILSEKFVVQLCENYNGNTHYYVENEETESKFKIRLKLSQEQDLKPFVSFLFTRQVSMNTNIADLEIYLDTIESPDVCEYSLITIRRQLSWTPNESLDESIRNVFSAIFDLQNDCQNNFDLSHCLTNELMLQPNLPYFPVYTKLMYILRVYKSLLYQNVFASVDPVTQCVTKRLIALMKRKQSMSDLVKSYIFSVEYMPAYFRFVQQSNEDQKVCISLVKEERKNFLGRSSARFVLCDSDEEGSDQSDESDSEDDCK